MGPERKTELQSPNAIERTAQEATALIEQSKRLVAELDETIQRAKALVTEQRSLLAGFRTGRRNRSG